MTIRDGLSVEQGGRKRYKRYRVRSTVSETGSILATCETRGRNDVSKRKLALLDGLKATEYSTEPTTRGTLHLWSVPLRGRTINALQQILTEEGFRCEHGRNCTARLIGTGAGEDTRSAKRKALFTEKVRVIEKSHFIGSLLAEWFGTSSPDYLALGADCEEASHWGMQEIPGYDKPKWVKPSYWQWDSETGKRCVASYADFFLLYSVVMKGLDEATEYLRSPECIRFSLEENYAVWMQYRAKKFQQWIEEHSPKTKQEAIRSTDNSDCLDYDRTIEIDVVRQQRIALECYKEGWYPPLLP